MKKRDTAYIFSENAYYISWIESYLTALEPSLTASEIKFHQAVIRNGKL